jgi:hypothetical protein
VLSVQPRSLDWNIGELDSIQLKVLPVVMKNCEPLVFGPAFAMLNKKGTVCFSLKFSSANFSP